MSPLSVKGTAEMGVYCEICSSTGPSRGIQLARGPRRVARLLGDAEHSQAGFVGRHVEAVVHEAGNAGGSTSRSAPPVGQGVAVALLVVGHCVGDLLAQLPLPRRSTPPWTTSAPCAASTGSASWAGRSAVIGPACTPPSTQTRLRMVLLAELRPNQPHGPTVSPQPGFPMALRTRSEQVNWPGVSCDGQVDPTVKDPLWATVNAYDPLGATWGSPAACCASRSPASGAGTRPRPGR